MPESVLPKLTTDQRTQQLPADPRGLLTQDQHQQLHEDLSRLAKLRRDAETTSGSLKLA